MFLNGKSTEVKHIEVKISIAIVCFQASGTIEKTILSVIRQSYPHIEFLIMDGASTDGTLDIISKYEDCLRCKSESDSGIYDAMNKVTEWATGDFLLFLGADDVLYSDTVIEDVCCKIDSMESLYYGNVLLNDSGKILNRRYSNYRLAIMNICQQVILYPKSVYKNQKFDTNYIVYADYVYNLNLKLKGISFVHLPITIAIYNTSGFSSRTCDEKFYRDKMLLVRQSLGIGPALFLWVYRKYRYFFPKR